MPMLLTNEAGEVVQSTAPVIVSGGDSAVATHLIDTKAHVHDAVTLTPSGGSVATDADLGDYFAFTMDGDTVLANPTGTIVAGQKAMWAVTQSGGGHSLTFGTDFNLGLDLASITNSVVDGATDYIGAVYSGSEWHIIAFLRGY